MSRNSWTSHPREIERVYHDTLKLQSWWLYHDTQALKPSMRKNFLHVTIWTIPCHSKARIRNGFFQLLCTEYVARYGWIFGGIEDKPGDGGGANEDASTRVVQAFHWTYLRYVLLCITIVGQLRVNITSFLAPSMFLTGSSIYLQMLHSPFLWWFPQRRRCLERRLLCPAVSGEEGMNLPRLLS